MVKKGWPGDREPSKAMLESELARDEPGAFLLDWVSGSSPMAVLELAEVVLERLSEVNWLEFESVDSRDGNASDEGSGCHDDHTHSEYADVARAAQDACATGELEDGLTTTTSPGFTIEDALEGFDDGENLVERVEHILRTLSATSVDPGDDETPATLLTTITEVASRLDTAEASSTGTPMPAGLRAALERNSAGLPENWASLHVEEIVLRRITCIHPDIREKAERPRRAVRGSLGSKIARSPQSSPGAPTRGLGER